MKLSYDVLVPSLVAAVPGAEGVVEKLASEGLAGNSEPHVVFGFLNELLLASLRSDSGAAFLSDYFAFLEAMTCSGDVFVVDVVRVTVCERLVEEPAEFAKAMPMMGPRTRALSLEVEREVGPGNRGRD